MIETELTSKKGFYIGDICYVLDDSIYHGIWGKADYQDGVYETPFGKFAAASTAFGDGCYDDQYGHNYGVDAGVIGIVPWEILEQQKKWKDLKNSSDTEKLNSLGRFVEGTEADFCATGRGKHREDGLFEIDIRKPGVETHFEIHTEDDYYEEDEDDYVDQDYEDYYDDYQDLDDPDDDPYEYEGEEEDD